MALISFARGAPSPDCLPLGELADCARAAVERDGATALSYGPAGGYGPLREWIAERHGVEPGRVLLTNGGLQGLIFVAQALLERRPGTVLVEAPTYDRTLTLLDRLGADVRTLPMDDEGLDVDALAAVLRGPDRPSFLYTIPTFQNPSGRTLGPERRRRLVETAAEHGLPVVEDDPYGLVRFEGDAPPLLHELAADGAVVYASSFSKTVAPGIRVGYFVLPREIVAPIEAAAVATYITPVLLGEAVVWELIRRGGFEPNLERVRGLLRERRDAMLAALERELGDAASWSRPGGGYFLWLDLAEGVDAAELLSRAAGVEVAFVKGSDFFPRGEGGRSSARLAYSYASPDEIAEGIGRLASLLPAAARA
jgi:DNA-binding transcriptional MocR family regulator